MALSGCAVVTGSQGGERRPSSGITRESIRQGAWRLDIARDRFSVEVACRLRSGDGRSLYRSGAVGFRFGRDRDVREAFYRVDGGAPHAQRDDLPKLTAIAVPMDRGGPDNALQGIVWVPLDALAAGQSIAIAPQPREKPMVFALRGLVALHEIGIARGCVPESRFIER